MTATRFPLRRRAAPDPLVQFRTDVLHGLGAAEPYLPAKYFYDEAGSRLFEEITGLEEYYLTRAELGIMRDHAAEMAACLGQDCLLIEYGSGSSAKTRLLLDHGGITAYVPIDLSDAALFEAAADLAQAYPDVEVLPVCGDFAQPVDLPAPRVRPARRVVYFPGSTIGNFTPGEAAALLGRTRALCGPGGAFLLGVDLQKDPEILHAAYNDRRGVTAAFNRNLLVRINRELGADFNVQQFEHRAFYNTDHGRIEMHLLSKSAQCVHVADARFRFAAGDSIRTEYSYKYTLAGLSALASSSGFRVRRTWTDPLQHFSVHLLTE